MREIAGKMPQTKSATHTSREPAQSTCTWTLHKRHSMREFTEKKMPQTRPRPTLCASLRSRNALGHFTRATFAREFTGKMPADQLEHPDQAPAFTLTVRTPQCGHTVWRTKTIGSAWLPRGTLLNLLDWWMVSIGGFLFGLIISLFPPGKPLHSHIFSFRRRPGTMLRSN